MENSPALTRGDRHPLATYHISAGRRQAGRAVILFASLGFAAIFLVQFLHAAGIIAAGFDNWRPVLYAYVVWALALIAGQVMIRGERGQPAVFLLPALL